MQPLAEKIAPVPAPFFVPLQVYREFSRYCVECDCLRTFVGTHETEFGTWGHCIVCGDERIAPWTRTTSGECA